MELGAPSHERRRILRRPSDALLDREEAVEHVEAGDEDIVTVRDQLAPTRAVAGRLRRRLEQAEVDGVPVGADHPAFADVIDGVFVAALARQQHPERQRRIVDARVPCLGRDGAARVDQQEAPVLGHADGGVERLVLLLVHDRVERGIGAELVHAHAQAEQRDRVLLDVQHAPVIGGPGDALLDVRHRIGQPFTGLERAEAQACTGGARPCPRSARASARRG